MEERRRFERTKAVFATIISPSQNDSIRFTTTSLDISEGGMKVKIASKILPGSSVIIKLSLPMFEKELTLNGDVVWALPASGSNNLFEIGIKFSVLSYVDKEYIQRYMLEKNKPKLKPAVPIQNILNVNIAQGGSVKTKYEYILLIIFCLIFFGLIFAVINFFINKTGIFGVHF